MEREAGDTGEKRISEGPRKSEAAERTSSETMGPEVMRLHVRREGNPPAVDGE